MTDTVPPTLEVEFGDVTIHVASEKSDVFALGEPIAAYGPDLERVDLAFAVALRFFQVGEEMHLTETKRYKGTVEYDRQAAYFSVLWRAQEVGRTPRLGKLALANIAARRKPVEYQTTSYGRVAKGNKNVSKGFKDALARLGLDYDTLDRPEKKRGRPMASKNSKRRERS